MQIVEVFLPLKTGGGATVTQDIVEGIVGGLADRFGGATAFTRSPAEGLWKESDSIQKDRIIIIEVMVETVDVGWWADYRSRLEAQFEQDEVLIRVTACRKI
ncbi:MAG: hypothetical protein Q8M31_20925 [Beijerinckiaceae bacterium]|nr:hypothetical protein [Beijerinckiaceae bacterium]